MNKLYFNDNKYLIKYCSNNARDTIQYSKC